MTCRIYSKIVRIRIDGSRLIICNGKFTKKMQIDGKQHESNDWIIKKIFSVQCKSTG